MKALLHLVSTLLVTGYLFASSSFAAPGGGANVVTYNPAITSGLALAPYMQTVSINITTPASFPTGSSVTVNLGATVLGKPTMVAASDALSFVSISPSVLTFTGPNQTRTMTVSLLVPAQAHSVDNYGSYAWSIKPIDWPASLNLSDPGALINLTLLPTPTSAVPSVVIAAPTDGTTYTYTYPNVPTASNPIALPAVSFTAAVAPGGEGITNAGVTFNDTPLAVQYIAGSLGQLVLAGTTNGPSVTGPGIYAVQVVATNALGTSYATADVNVVVVAPAPTLTITPANGASYNLPAAGNISVPVLLSASSVYGNIKTLTATLNGVPVTLQQTGVDTALTATGTVNLNITSAGAYTLTATGTSDYGTVTQSAQFTVTATAPVATISALTPADGTVYQRYAGAAATQIPYTFSASTPSGSTLQSVTVQVNGTNITPTTLTGVGTKAVTGAGTIKLTTPGSYTLTVTVDNGSGTTTRVTHFTVKQTLNACLSWLPPISLNKTIQGGSTMPIKFTLQQGGNFVNNRDVIISIYEIYANGTTSPVTVYPYGADSNPNPPTYAINGKKYQLNFATATGVHRYRIEVYYAPEGAASIQLLGSKELNTRVANGGDCGGEDDDRRNRDNRDACDGWGR